MSDNKTPTRYTGIDRRTPRLEPGAAKPAAREAYKTGGRHAAITNHLYSWHSYKNWADKIRGNWEDKK
jgi:hypothetical protein